MAEKPTNDSRTRFRAALPQGRRGTHVRELARTAGVYLGREYGATALKNTYTYHRSARILSSTQSDTTNRPKCLGADRARGRPWLISGTQHENTRTST